VSSPSQLVPEVHIPFNWTSFTPFSSVFLIVIVAHRRKIYLVEGGGTRNSIVALLDEADS
jgi:hypothetical protein